MDSRLQAWYGREQTEDQGEGQCALAAEHRGLLECMPLLALECTAAPGAVDKHPTMGRAPSCKGSSRRARASQKMDADGHVT
eukprot:644605-Pelagomonas_calceolata.AAC.3